MIAWGQVFFVPDALFRGVFGLCWNEEDLTPAAATIAA
jgi:hypothetical protein